MALENNVLSPGAPMLLTRKKLTLPLEIIQTGQIWISNRPMETTLDHKRL